MIKKYRKKPVVVEAVEWTGHNLKEIFDFTGVNGSAKHLLWAELVELVENDGLKIFTLEGAMKATIGDYIIKGVQDECYPCKPDIFKATYELAE